MYGGRARGVLVGRIAGLEARYLASWLLGCYIMMREALIWTKWQSYDARNNLDARDE